MIVKTTSTSAQRGVERFKLKLKLALEPVEVLEERAATMLSSAGVGTRGDCRISAELENRWNKLPY